MPPLDRLLRSRRLSLALLGLWALSTCGGSPVSRRMVKINRAYLDVREHMEVEDYAAVAEAGARIAELAEVIRPLKPEAEYQHYADALRDAGLTVQRAGQAEDRTAAVTAFVALGRRCADCHRWYRDEQVKLR